MQLIFLDCSIIRRTLIVIGGLNVLRLACDMSMVRGTSCGSRTRLVVHEQQGDDHHHPHVDTTSYASLFPVVSHEWGARGNLERQEPGPFKNPARRLDPEQ